jgi:hypothetical protein
MVKQRTTVYYKEDKLKREDNLSTKGALEPSKCCFVIIRTFWTLLCKDESYGGKFGCAPSHQYGSNPLQSPSQTQPPWFEVLLLTVQINVREIVPCLGAYLQRNQLEEQLQGKYESGLSWRGQRRAIHLRRWAVLKSGYFFVSEENQKWTLLRPQSIGI